MNKHLLQFLAQNYNEKSSESEKPFISSHWAECLKRLHIETSQDGLITSLTTKNTGLDTFERRHWADGLLDTFCILFHWLRLPWKREMFFLARTASRVCRAMKRRFSFDVFRQLYSLALLRRNFSSGMKKRRLHILMIGDGYGILSAVFKAVHPDSTLILVDLGKTLLVQATLCQLAHPKKKHLLFKEVTDLDTSDFVYCPAEFLNELSGFRYDIAVNIVSMHEMPPSSIRLYFDFLRSTMEKDNLFYCCNREYKQLQGGEKTLFKDYPWHAADRILTDGLCPWHQLYFSRGRAPSGPRVLGRRIPWIQHYRNDTTGYGRILHRLCSLEVTHGGAAV